jgi:hypothetical protein
MNDIWVLIYKCYHKHTLHVFMNPQEPVQFHRLIHYSIMPPKF